jgi:hypothetical protein
MPAGIYTSVNTTNGGHFNIKPRYQPMGLFIRSPQGYVWIPADSLKPDQDITLSRWARLDLTVKQGANPMPRARVTVSPLAAGDFQSVLGIWSVLSDEQGRVTLDQILPGENRITWLPDDSKLSTRERRESSKLPPREIHVNIKPGETQTVALGGVGRTITGTIDGDIRDFDHRRGLLRSSTGPIHFDLQPDNSFTVTDVPPGDCQLTINLGITWGKNIRIAETHAVARANFKISPTASDTAAEPLDIGKVPVTATKVLELGQPFPKLSGKTPKGEPLTIDHFHGRAVLVQAGPPTFLHSRGEIDWQHALHSRFGHHPMFSMLTLMPNQPAAQASAGDPPVPWPIMFLDAPKLPEELESSASRLFLIDDNGNLAAKNITAAQVYAMLDWTLEGKPDPRVTFDYVPQLAARQNPAFTNIPAPSTDDAAAGARVTLIGGVPSWDTPKSDVTVLTDGKFAPTEDAPAEALFFQAGTLEGRFRLDLSDLTNIAEVRTYSWHKDTRAAQVYRVFASDGTAPNFDPAPAIGMDPAAHGWTHLALIDTRPDLKPVGVQYEAIGGRYAVSISDKQKGTLGTHRHLLFQVFVTESDDVFGHTFYHEIDVLPVK